MKKENREELIEKYLRGALTGEELHLFRKWIEASPENWSLLKERAGNWIMREGEDAGTDQSWRELREHIGPVKTGTDRNRRLVYVIARVAAILLIGLILGQFTGSWFKRSADSNAFYTVHTDSGEKTRVTLADGSIVWLNSESELRIHSTGFAGKRVVELQGEAYFEVRKNPEVPFIVKTADYNVEVLGTEFNVMCYSNFKRTETTLVNGLVRIEKDDQCVMLKPGQSVAYENQRFMMKETSVMQAIAWKDDQFYFDAIPLNELVMRLERWYDVTITIADESLESRLYSGVFRNEETIWQVLEVIEKTSPVQYEKKGFREIVIMEKD
jgi:transmembrane sensor